MNNKETNKSSEPATKADIAEIKVTLEKMMVMIERLSKTRSPFMLYDSAKVKYNQIDKS